MRTVGVVLDPLAVNPTRTVAGQLRLALAADPGAAPGGRRERIAAVLDVCGLGDQARRRIAELTEGMTVRLALAQALLGDPQVLLLDEPDYGLEPEGQDWLNALLRAYAAQGRCVLVTGQNTDVMLGRADRILVLDEGRLAGQRTVRQAARELSGDCVIVRTPQVLRFAAVLVGAGAEPTQLDGACLEVRGLDRARIGDLAFRNEIPLHELAVRSAADDPVVAVLEACRRPPAVVPVQAPPAGRVPEHAEAQVSMPFTHAAETVASAGSSTSASSSMSASAGATSVSASRAEAEADAAAESALLSVMEVEAPRRVVEEVSAPAEPREPLGNVRVRTAAGAEDGDGEQGSGL
jgi:ABC-2 type transport system ATP-binding protein